MLRLVRFILWLLAWLSGWAHSRIIAPLVSCWEDRVLGTYEQVVTAIVRESWAEWTRFMAGASAWFIGLFQHNYRDKLRKSWHQGSTQGHEPARPSTLNAIVEAMQDNGDASTEGRLHSLIMSYKKSCPCIPCYHAMPMRPYPTCVVWTDTLLCYKIACSHSHQVQILALLLQVGIIVPLCVGTGPHGAHPLPPPRDPRFPAPTLSTSPAALVSLSTSMV